MQRHDGSCSGMLCKCAQKVRRRFRCGKAIALLRNNRVKQLSRRLRVLYYTTTGSALVCRLMPAVKCH